MKKAALAWLAIALTTTSCLPLPHAASAPTEIWTVLQPDADSLREEAPTTGCSAVVDLWIALDTVSMRPFTLDSRRGGELREDRYECAGHATIAGIDNATARRRVSVVTSFQGSRYHPETVRAIGESPDALSRTAGAIARMAIAGPTRGVLLDFQEMSGEDLPALMEVSRAIADSARALSPDSVGMIIPAADSSGYPGRILGRVADILLVKIFPEHGVGNPAGPIVSVPWFTRQLGTRAGEVGVNRIVAGIPADGVLWNARSGNRRISYAEALRLAESAAVSVVRDPASGNLHAVSTRDGWELWLSDHELIVRLIAEGRRIGVTRFALFGLDGADPKLWQSLPQPVK